MWIIFRWINCFTDVDESGIRRKLIKRCKLKTMQTPGNFTQRTLNEDNRYIRSFEVLRDAAKLL